MNPQDQQLLARLTLVVKKIVYDPQRFKVFLNMLGTQAGALTAVHTILAVIQQHTQIPPQLLPQLGVNAYLIMVEVAVKVTGHKPDPQIVHSVIQAIMAQGAQGSSQQGQQNPPQAAPQQAPQGIIGSQMGAQ